MTIESEKVHVALSANAVYDYVSNMNNLQHLLPADRIENFEGSTDSCSFKIKNLATIQLLKTGGIPGEKLQITTGEKTPFPFSLDVLFNPAGENASNAQIICEADVNPFMKMMVEKPLANLFNYMANRLVDLHGGSGAQSA